MKHNLDKTLLNKVFNGQQVLSTYLHNDRRYCVCRCLTCNREHRVLYQNLRIKKNLYCGVKSCKAPIDSLYPVWKDMKQRCNTKTHVAYANYGGRGIQVCKRWLNYYYFHLDMFPKPKGYSLDRINNEGNYEPSNCRWVTIANNNKNQRRTIRVSIGGREFCLQEACKILSLNRESVKSVHKWQKSTWEEAILYCITHGKSTTTSINL